MPSAVDIVIAALLGLFGVAVLVGGIAYLRDAEERFRRAWLAMTAPETDPTAAESGTRPLKLRGTLSAENQSSPPFLTETPAKLRFARIARPWSHTLVNWLALRATSDAEKRRTVFQAVVPTAVTLDIGRRRVTVDASPDDVVPVVPRSDWDETRRYDGLTAAPSATAALLRDRDIDPATLDDGWFESRLISERGLALGDELRVFGTGTVRQQSDGMIEVTGNDLVYTTAGWRRVALREISRSTKSVGIGLFGLVLGIVVLAVVILGVTPIAL